MNINSIDFNELAKVLRIETQQPLEKWDWFLTNCVYVCGGVWVCAPEF